MPLVSHNPATNQVLQAFPEWDAHYLVQALKKTHNTQQVLAQTPFAARAKVLHQAAIHLRANNERFAALITMEMGKLLREARAEVEKCA